MPAESELRVIRARPIKWVGVTVTTLLAGVLFYLSVIPDSADDPPPAWLIGMLASTQALYRPVVGGSHWPSSFPPVEPVINDGATPGELFLTTKTSPFERSVQSYPGYVASFDVQTGQPTRWLRTPTKGYLFQPQPALSGLLGEGATSYAIATRIGPNGGGHDSYHIVTDAKMKPRFTITTGVPNGTTDTHEFLTTEENTVYLLSYQSRSVDLSVIQGQQNARVYDPVVVERSFQGKTIWHWNGRDHIEIQDAVGPDVDFAAAPPRHVDYAHPNAISVTPDGNLLISLKHQDCVLKISRETREVIWRLGGRMCKKNEFRFVDDPYNGFSHQHSVRSLTNGNVLLFDNGTLHEQQTSRAVEYEINEEDRTARLKWSYSNGQFTHAQGSVQRLCNGNTVIGWGFETKPFVSEVTPDGRVVYAANLPEGQIVYRVYHSDPAGHQCQSYR